MSPPTGTAGNMGLGLMLELYARADDISATSDVARMSYPPVNNGGMRVLVVEGDGTLADRIAQGILAVWSPIVLVRPQHQT